MILPCQQYRMEDNLLKYFPEQIKQDQEFIAGFKADMETLAAHPHPIITVENSPAKTAALRPHPRRNAPGI